MNEISQSDRGRRQQERVIHEKVQWALNKEVPTAYLPAKSLLPEAVNKLPNLTPIIHSLPPVS